MSGLPEHFFSGIAGLTALLGLVAAWLKLRPRRFIGWLAAVKEREALLAMLEAEQQVNAHEKAWGLYWRTQAQECLKAFQDQFRAEAQKDEQEWIDSHAGGGTISSSGVAGPTRKERLTG